MGVRKAMDIAIEAAHRKRTPIYTFGPLIHNPQAMELLNTKGIRIFKEGDVPCRDGTIIIRAHGVSPEKLKEIENLFGEVIDATCPRVKKVQNIIRLHAEKGFRVVIVGDKDHPEVEGLLGFSRGQGMVIASREEIERIPGGLPLCVVAQTTQDEAIFESIARDIQGRFPMARIFNTICQSTHRRQSDILMLSKEVDAMIVVGGKESANTRRLAQLSASTGKPTYHVESEEELDPLEIGRYSTIGITAGASTPNWMIKKVIGKVRRIRPLKRRTGLDRLFRLWELLIKTNIYLALGAGGLSLATCLMQGIRPYPEYMLVASFYVFSMHLINRYTDKGAGKFNDPIRAEFYEKNQGFFVPVSIAGILLSLFLAFKIGPVPFYVLLILTMLGAIYNVRIIPSKWPGILPYRRLRDIPCSKTLSVAFGWGIVTSILPSLKDMANVSWSALISFLITSTVVFVRSAQFDILDIQGDRIAGKETIPILIGEKYTMNLSIFLTLICAISLMIFAYLGLITSIGYWLIGVMAYLQFCLFLYRERPPMETLHFEGLMDGTFILAGITSLLWKALHS